MWLQCQVLTAAMWPVWGGPEAAQHVAALRAAEMVNQQPGSVCDGGSAIGDSAKDPAPLAPLTINAGGPTSVGGVSASERRAQERRAEKQQIQCRIDALAAELEELERRDIANGDVDVTPFFA